MEILNSIIIILLNISIFYFLQKKDFKILIWTIVFSLFFIFLNFIFENFSNKFLAIILFYSFALIVLNYMSKIIDVTKNNDNISEKVKKSFNQVKSFILLYLFPIFTTVFQIMIIWNKNLQNGLVENL